MNYKEFKELKNRMEARKDWYELEVKTHHVSKKTGKAYSKWHFTNWAQLPDLNKVNHWRKGKYLIVKTSEGELQRYNLESGVSQ